MWRPLLTQNQMFQTLVTPKLPGERKSWVIKLPALLLRAGNKVDRDHIIILNKIKNHHVCNSSSPHLLMTSLHNVIIIDFNFFS